MRVYETGGCGLLYFSMFGTRSTPHFASSDITHHSLYRISSSELGEIIRFTEGLERGGREWIGYIPPHPFFRFYLDVVAIGLIICIAAKLIMRRFRKVKTTNANAVLDTDGGGRF